MRSLFFFIFAFYLLGEALAGTSEEGLAWLAEKAKEPGVVTLESGLMYKELVAGHGKSPQLNDPTRCNYEGRLIDGTLFDSSYAIGMPLTFAPNQVIPGWTEAMQLMKEGSKWNLYIPSELAYGDAGAGSKIPGGAALEFIIEIVDVLDSNPAMKTKTLQKKTLDS